MLLKSAYSVDEIRAMVSQTPFGRCRIDTSGIGFMAWLERRAFDRGGYA
jgi:hypothetical protein